MPMIELDRLLRGHPLDQIKRWTAELRYFVVMGEYFSGPVELGPGLEVDLRFDGHDDLVALLTTFGAYRRYTGPLPKTSGTAGEDWPVNEHPDIARPRETTIAGDTVLLWVDQHSMRVILDEQLSDALIARGQRLEAWLDEHDLASRVLRPTLAPNAFSNDNYPGTF
ncbi:MAG: hypothetical protein QM831_30535 [Kofleriaceae bacterium]